MIPDRFRRATRVAAGVLFALAIAATASAQSGQIRGKVVDAEGKPVADAKVVIDYKGNITRVTETKTNRQGSFMQVGLQSGPYEVTVEKGDLKQMQPARVSVGNTTELEFALVPGGTGPTTPDDAKRLAEFRKELEGKYVAAVALIEAGNHDEGIAGLNALIAETGGCAVCEAKIGEALWKKGDEAGAEAAFKKAIAVDPKQPDAYAALASLYNKQQKFDEAAEMSKKASELSAPTAEGGGNASVVFNQGIIFWNQSKIPEAKAQFEQAIKIDAKFADAHYWLGMALLNEGNLTEAVGSFEKYLSLAPDGQHAATAKGILASIKK
ncbi:MAG TPA: tetratricopeptide repeat protein [Vicinamibacterales bacterium]|nr:tetratricopeptide repeat protein [Vicinamibacterales bacterium]